MYAPAGQELATAQFRLWIGTPGIEVIPRGELKVTEEQTVLPQTPVAVPAQ